MPSFVLGTRKRITKIIILYEGKCSTHFHKKQNDNQKMFKHKWSRPRCLKNDKIDKSIYFATEKQATKWEICACLSLYSVSLFSWKICEAKAKKIKIVLLFPHFSLQNCLFLDDKQKFMIETLKRAKAIP